MEAPQVGRALLHLNALLRFTSQDGLSDVNRLNVSGTEELGLISDGTVHGPHERNSTRRENEVRRSTNSA